MCFIKYILSDSAYERSDRDFMWRIEEYLLRKEEPISLSLHYEGTNRQASEDHRLFGQNRKNFLLHSPNSVLVKHLGDLLLRIHDRNGKRSSVKTGKNDLRLVAQFDVAVDQQAKLGYDRQLGINEGYCVLYGRDGRSIHLLLLRRVPQYQGRNALRLLGLIRIIETSIDAIRSGDNNDNCIFITENA